MTQNFIPVLTSFSLVTIQSSIPNFIMVKVSGMATKFYPGKPILFAHKITKKGLLVFHFLTDSLNENTEKNVKWELEQIFDLRSFSSNIQGIKVVAGQNSDIIIF